MRKIVDGFLRFQCDTFPSRTELFKQSATSLNPLTLTNPCSDNRLRSG
jgi:carbonic anhydrase